MIEGKDRQTTKGQVSEGAWEWSRNKKTTGGGFGAHGALSGGAGRMDGMMEGAVILNSVNWLGIPVLHVRRYCVLCCHLVSCWMSSESVWVAGRSSGEF